MLRTVIREATGFLCMIDSILETASKGLKIKGKSLPIASGTGACIQFSILADRENPE
jgi:hypothetical protein